MCVAHQARNAKVPSYVGSGTVCALFWGALRGAWWPSYFLAEAAWFYLSLAWSDEEYSFRCWLVLASGKKAPCFSDEFFYLWRGVSMRRIWLWTSCTRGPLCRQILEAFQNVYKVFGNGRLRMSVVLVTNLDSRIRRSVSRSFCLQILLECFVMFHCFQSELLLKCRWDVITISMYLVLGYLAP